MCVCVCACVCPARVATPIFGGLSTARRVDACRCLVLAGASVGAESSSSKRVRPGVAVDAD